MDPELVLTLTKDIHRRFPVVAEIKPKVRKQPVPKGHSDNIPPEKRNYLLTFKKEAEGPGGQIIPRWVRVVVSPQGKIIKITTSK